MQVAETYSGAEYARSNPIPRSQLFNARLELELEKQVAALQLIEVNLRMDPAQVLTELYCLNNCLGTRTFLPVLRIRDVNPGSDFFPIPDPHQRI
jgi:hypothetical protein